MPTDKPSATQAKEEFEQFLFEMAEMLEELQKLAAKAGVGTLDYSYEALDRLEALIGLVLDGKLALPGQANTNQLATTAARYLGETVIRRTGGKWSYVKSTKSRSFGQPAIVDIPALPKTYEFLPLASVRTYARARRSGLLREHAEKHNLALMRTRAEGFKRDMESELSALADEIRSRHAKAPPLDFTVESLDVLEQLLSETLDAKSATNEREHLERRIARYMGEVFRRRVDGDWRLEEDPSDIDFGEMRVRSFTPLSVVRNFELRRQQGLLASAVRSILARLT